MKIKGVLFDLDGTIVDSEPSRLKSSNTILKPYNIKITKKDWDEKYKRCSSIKIFEQIIKQNKKNMQNIAPEELYSQAHKLREQIEKKEDAKLIKGFQEFYNHLIQNQIKIAICSGGKREHVELLLKKININLKQIIYLGREDYNQRKPSPDAWLQGLKKLNLKPDEVLLFDDSYTGIEAGKAAKIKNLIAINCETEKGIKKLKPILIIKDFTQLDFNKILNI